MPDSRLDLINTVLRELPVPLVGSVAYDGNKATKTCTPKAFAAFVDCYTRVRPMHVLEIGTHAGGSALMTLALTDAAVTSVDIGENWIEPNRSFSDWGVVGEEGGLFLVDRVLNRHFPDRFNLIVGDSTAADTKRALFTVNLARPFDLAFIDGNHEFSYVRTDIETAKGLGIRHLILDDYNGGGGDVGRAARETGLEIVAHWDDIHSGGAGFCLARANR